MGDAYINPAFPPCPPAPGVRERRAIAKADVSPRRAVLEHVATLKDGLLDVMGLRAALGGMRRMARRRLPFPVVAIAATVAARAEVRPRRAGWVQLDFPRAVDHHAGQASARRQKLLGSR